MKHLSIVVAIFISGCASKEYPWAKSQGPCKLTEAQKEIAWVNVISAMKSQRPKHSEYCELAEPASKQLFTLVEGQCRTYFACGKSVNGDQLLHGEIFVYINHQTQEITGIYDVAW